MNALGLAKEWLDTDEAKEILFGEKVNYDAVDNKWEVLAESRARLDEHELANQPDTDDEVSDDEVFGFPSSDSNDSNDSSEYGYF
jgi:hypothetical protein